MIRPATGARAAFLGGVASLALNLSASAQTAPVPAGTQEFATRTDIVLADVTVIDGKGQPVPDLGVADFTLSVNGRVRSIQAVEYVASSGRRPLTATAAETRGAPSDARDGRLLLIAADEAHLSFGAGRAVLRAAENLIDRLAPEDRVGVVRLPMGGGVEFTQDHARAIAGLRGVNGRASRPTRLVATVYPSEAVDLLENGGHSEWQTALARECSSAASAEQCRDAMVMESQTLVTEMRTDASATFRSLEQLLRNLQPLKAPIHMVLISEGLYVSRNSESMASLAALAASARVSMNIVRPAKDWYDASAPGISSNRNLDDQLIRGGLEQLAGEMRGGFYTAVGDGSNIFDRIGAELSGYYLLAFEPTNEDRTGRERRIKVEVKRRGVSLRSRSTFVIPSPDAVTARSTEPPAPAPTAAPVPLAPLSAPPSANAVPVRLNTYSMFNAEDGRVRLLIAAEAGDSVSEPSSWRASLMLKDARGQIVTNSAATVSLSPARPTAPSPALFATEVTLSPGDYLLTLTLMGADGRVGTVERKLAAQFRPAPGGLSVSDLVVVTEPEAGASMRVTPSALVDRDRAMAFLEVHHAESSALDAVRATFEVAQSESGPAIVSTQATSDTRANGTQRAFAGSLLVNALPPGDYVMRGTLIDAGGTRSQFTRPFQLDRSRSTTGASATGARTGALPLMRATAAVPAFSLQGALAPAVVRAFAADLEQRHPSPAATKAFQAGLSELQAGRSAQASELFRQTLRAAPDFVGVAFYLGSCYAAIGKDREAIGAWQMSLLSKGADAVYPVLIDAMLRVGENKKALDLLAEAPAAWSDPSERMRREAVARAAIGEDEPALALLMTLLSNPKPDRALLFVGIQVTYHLYASRGLTKEERERFAAWTRQYESLGGEESALVRVWRDHVGQ